MLNFKGWFNRSAQDNVQKGSKSTISNFYLKRQMYMFQAEMFESIERTT